MKCMPLHDQTELRWFMAMTGVYILGNVFAMILIWYLAGISLLLVYLLPWIITVVPVAGILLGYRKGLLQRSSRFQDGSLILVFLYVMTWAGIMYLYIRNALPVLSNVLGL